MHVDEFDMNTWMDVQVDEKSGTPAIFEDQEGKYGIYRIRTKIPESINGRLPVLHFESVWGECSVYINGELRGETARDTGTAEIRVLVKSLNFNAGLHSMVVFR